MNPLTTDTLEILRSSRWGIDVESLAYELSKTWPIRRGEAVRVVTEADVLDVLIELESKRLAACDGGMWRAVVEVAETEKQGSLF